MGRHPRQQYAGNRYYRQADAHAGDHPDHARTGAVAHPQGQDRAEPGRRSLLAQACVPDVYPVLRARVHHHHGVHHGRRTGRRVYAAQDAVQVLYRYGDGGYRHEYQYRKAGQDRRQADFHGILLLGRYRVRQHRDAALARVPLSEKKSTKD